MISPTVTIYRGQETQQIVMLQYPAWRDLGWSLKAPEPEKPQPVKKPRKPRVKPTIEIENNDD